MPASSGEDFLLSENDVYFKHNNNNKKHCQFGPSIQN